MRVFFFYLIFFSINLSQTTKSLKIVSPKTNTSYKLDDDDFYLEWKSDMSDQTRITIEYSIDGENSWTLIDTIDVGEIATSIEFDTDLNLKKGKVINSDGAISIRIHQGNLIEDIIAIRVPELSNSGKIRFSNANSGLNDSDISIVYGNNKKAKVGELIPLVSGVEYDYQAKVDKYGTTTGNFTVDPGEIKVVKIDVKETWGEVVFKSKIDSFYIEIDGTSIYVKPENLYFSEKEKRIRLPQGEYVYSVSKDDYDPINKESFSVAPGYSNSIDINLVSHFVKVKFISNQDSVKIYTKRYSRSRRNSKSDFIGYSNKLIDIKRGLQILAFEKDNYRTKVISQNITQNTIEVRVDLVREHSSLGIKTRPEGASIYLDNVLLPSKTNFYIDSLNTGSYDIKVTMDGYRDYQERKIISDALPEEFFKILEAVQGQLWVSRPKRGDLLNLTINGENVIPVIRPNAIIHNLLPGSYDIKLEIEGYKEIEKQIVIEDNKIERIAKSEWEEKMIVVNLKPPKVAAEYLLYPKYNTNVFDITDKDTVILPFGTYTIIGNAPKHEKSKTHFTINSNEPEFIKPNLFPKTKNRAKTYGWFPGAGLVYAEKKKTGFSVMASTLGLGAFFLFSDNKYKTENNKLNKLQEDLMNQTDLEAIAAAKKLRNLQRDKVDKAAIQRDTSGILALVSYGFNLILTWRFHGL